MRNIHTRCLALMLAALPSLAHAGGMYEQSESSWNISDWLPSISSRGAPRKIEAGKAREEIERRQLEQNRSKLMQRQRRLQEKIQGQGDDMGRTESNLDPNMMQQQQAMPNSMPVDVGQDGAMDYRASNARMNMPVVVAPEPPPPPRGEDTAHPGLKLRTLPVLSVIVPHDGVLTVNEDDTVVVDEETVRSLESSLEPTKEPAVEESRPARIMQRGLLSVKCDREGGAVVTARYQLQIDKKSYHVVPLSLGNGLLLQATMGGNEVLVTPDGSAILQGPVQGELELSYSIAPGPEDEQRKIDLSLPDCPVVEVQGEIPRIGQLVEATGLAGLVPGELKDPGRTVFRGHATGAAVQVRYWNRPRDGRQPVATVDTAAAAQPVEAAEEEKARVNGWIHTEYKLADTLLTARTSAQFEITAPGISQLALKLSTRMELIDVTEEGSTEPLRHQWQPAEGGWGTLTVLLPARRTKPLHITVIQKRIEPMGATMKIELPPVVAVDLTKVHTSGSFEGPREGASIEIDCGPEGGGIEEMDITRIEERFPRTTQPLDAWRHEVPPGTTTPMVVETLSRRGKLDLQKFEIKGMNLDSMLTGEKVALTRARLEVINSDRQFLEITLPARGVIQSAYVRNRPVKPGVKDDKVLVIPLVRSAGRPFLVEIVYAQEIPEFEAAGIQRLSALKVAGRIERLDWRVYFPDRYLVREWFVGKGLRAVPRMAYSDHVPDISRDVAGQANALSNSQQMVFQQAIAAPRNDHGVSGALPVRLPFPSCHGGVSFEKIMVRDNDDQLTLSFAVLERRIWDYLVDLLIALSFMCSAGIFYARARGASVSGPLLGTLVSLGLLLVSQEIFETHTRGQRTVMIGVGAAIALLFLHLLFYPVRRMMVAGALFLVLSSGEAPAAEIPTAVVPYEEDGLQEVLDNPSVSTVVPHALRKQVEERLRKLQEEASAVASATPDRPPMGFLILEGDIQGRLEGSIARLEFVYRVQVLEDGWHRIPLISGDLTVSKVTIDGNDGEVVVEETRDLINQEYVQNENALSNLSDAKTQLMNMERTIPFQLLVNGKGAHEIRFQGEASVQESAGRHRLNLHPPLFPRGDLQLTFPSKGLNVQLNGQALVDPGSGDGAETRLTAPVGAQRPLVVEWTERASQAPVETVDIPEEVLAPDPGTDGSDELEAAAPAPASAPVAPTPAPEKPPLIVADTVSQITLDGTSLSGSTFFILNVHVSGVESLTFNCPPALTFYKVTEVGAPGGSDRVSKFRRADVGGKPGLVVSFRKKVKGPITLAMTYDLPYGAEAEKKKDVLVSIPSIECREAHVQAGVLGIEREGAVEMSEVTHKGLDVLEPDQLPDRIAQFMTTPARFAYRYHSPGWQLDLSVRKHEHQSLASAVITGLEAVTRLPETGFVTEVSYGVRNNGNPHLSLWLPPRTKAVRCRLANQDIQPDVGKDGSLEISLGSSSPDQLVNVQVEFEEVAAAQDAAPADTGKRSLELPRTSFAVTGTGMTWTVEAPPGSFITGTEGDLKPRRRFSGWNLPTAWTVPPPAESVTFDGSLVLWGESPKVVVTTGSRSIWMATCLGFAMLGMIAILSLASGLAWAHDPLRSLPRLLVPAALGLGAIALEPRLAGATAGVAVGVMPGVALVILILLVQLVRRLRAPATAASLILLLAAASAPPTEAQTSTAPSSVTTVTGTVTLTPPPALTSYQEIGRIFLLPQKSLPALLPRTGSQILLARNELEDIFDLGARPVLPPLAPVEPRAPIDHLILSGLLEGREDDGKLHFKGRYRVRTHRKGVLELGFDPGEISVTSLTLGGAPAALLPAAGGGLPENLQLLVDTGLNEVTIEFTLNVDRRQDVNYLQMQIPSCPDTELVLDIPGLDSVASIVPSTHLATKAVGDRLILSTHLKYGKTFFAQWQRPIKEETVEASATPTVEEEAPVFEVSGAQNAHLDSGRLEVRAILDIQVRAGSLSSLRIQHPDSFRIGEITGNEVAGWQPDRAGGTRVNFRSKMRGSIQLNLHGMTKVTSSGDETREISAALPRLGVEGAQGQKGHIRLMVPADEDLREDKLLGLVRTDTGEMVNSANSQVGQRIYQYVGSEYDLGFRLIRHPVIKVPSTRIPQGSVTLFVPPKGSWFGLVSYQVQNNTRQFLRLELPPKSQLLSCFVDGKPSQPSRVVDAGHENNPFHPTAYLIPLARSRVTDGVMSQFPIDLAYITVDQPELVQSGQLALALPVPDLSVDRLNVGLAMPPGILTCAEHPSLLPVSEHRQEASLSRILARTLKMEDVPPAGYAVGIALALPLAPFIIFQRSGTSKSLVMDARSVPDPQSGAMSYEAKEMVMAKPAPAAPALQAPGAYGGASPMRQRMDAPVGKSNTKRELGRKGQRGQNLAMLEGAISDDLDGMESDKFAVDEEFEEQAAGSGLIATEPTAVEAAPEVQVPSQQDFTRLLEGARTKKGALPVRVDFDTRNYRVARFEVVLHEGAQPVASAPDDFSGGAAFDRPQPLTVRYVDMRVCGPILAMFFLIFPAYLVSLAFGPGATLGRRLTVFTVAVVASLVAASLEVWGLSTFFHFKMGILLGAFALPFLHLIRTTSRSSPTAE